ncbi:MFS transporter [Kitasatospora sp. LaBMicrA B282]|uniref:MFS transporter n=1 Tax=Kitasatospora sp. LaBMicrA B282 TaxID=3420949 RepID=UPI003D0BEBD4
MTAAAPAPHRGRIRGYVTGYTFSMAGDQIWLTALGWSAAQLGKPILAGVVLGAGTIPRALLMLLGGSLVDRHGIRRLALATQSARVLAMAGATAAAVVAPHAWLPLLLVALVFGAIDAINVPALSAAPALMAPPDQLPRITGILQTAQRLATVAGAPAAGFLIAAGGTAGGTAACAALFAVALAALLAARLPDQPEPAEQSAAGAKGGIRYILGRPVLTILIVTIACLNFTILGSFNVGLPLLVQHHHWSAGTYGLIEGGFGAGAVVGAMAVALRRPTRRPAVTGLAWIAAQIPLLVAVGYLGSPAAVAVAAAGVGLILGPASALLIGLIQATADASYIGRVMSTVSFTSVGLTPISYLLFATLARTTSVSTAFLTNGVLEVAVVTIALANTSLRGARLPRTDEPEATAEPASTPQPATT